MDRETAIAYLVDHYNNPRHKRYLEGADISMPGGNPGCGDLVTVHLRAKPASDQVAEVTFEGSGCTISQAAASILLQKVNREQLSFQEVMDFTYEEMIELLGREVVGFRQRCATLALGTLKAAVKTIEMNRKLRAAGHSEADIRKLREAAAERAAGAGLVVGAGAEAASADASLRRQTDQTQEP